MSKRTGFSMYHVRGSEITGYEEDMESCYKTNRESLERRRKDNNDIL